jgi:hypothetical protein
VNIAGTGAAPLMFARLLERIQRDALTAFEIMTLEALTSLARLQRAEGALRAHEDEKFSYVVIQRGPRGK